MESNDETEFDSKVNPSLEAQVAEIREKVTISFNMLVSIS